ncbi:MAG: hypothetical protein IT462_05390 [Planctomycetes bacterium]|nr:hypothetical protein [Planctomycetota bacterium]
MPKADVFDSAAKVESVRVAVNDLYDAAIATVPNVLEKVTVPRLRDSLRSKYVEWANHVVRCYGKIAQPERNFNGKSPEAIGSGVLGFFRDHDLVGRLLATSLPTFRHFEDGPRATVADLGVLPPELVRPCDSLGIRSGLIEIPDSGAFDMLEIIEGRLEVKAKNLAWEDLAQGLHTIWLRYRIFALRLVSWVNARLSEFEDAVVPRAQVSAEKPGKRGGRTVKVRLAGAVRDRDLTNEPANFFIGLIRRKTCRTTSAIKRDLVEQLPEYGPFVRSVKQRHNLKGHNQSDAIPYHLPKDVVRRISVEKAPKNRPKK